ncbi:hypothetical protein Tco_1159441 [Tanacetum coccineum]
MRRSMWGGIKGRESGAIDPYLSGAARDRVCSHDGSNNLSILNLMADNVIDECTGRIRTDQGFVFSLSPGLFNLEVLCILARQVTKVAAMTYVYHVSPLFCPSDPIEVVATVVVTLWLILFCLSLGRWLAVRCVPAAYTLRYFTKDNSFCRFNV